MDVSHKLAAIIIKAHIKNKQDEEIDALSELGRGEMS